MSGEDAFALYSPPSIDHHRGSVKQCVVEAKIKEYHEKKRTERKTADAMYMHYTGKRLNSRRDNNLIKGGDNKDSTECSEERCSI